MQVGNFIHYLATFLAGLVVGFVSAWRLALLSIAVIPGIAFAGGLYAYTLTGLTSKSRDSYANAGIIAEQVARLSSPTTDTGHALFPCQQIGMAGRARSLWSVGSFRSKSPMQGGSWAHGINMMSFWILSSFLVRSSQLFSEDNLSFHVVLHLFHEVALLGYYLLFG